MQRFYEKKMPNGGLCLELACIVQRSNYGIYRVNDGDIAVVYAEDLLRRPRPKRKIILPDIYKRLLSCLVEFERIW
jgi:hypothetical protein